ncbi:MAG: hypothetical protein VX087_01765 [Pseudomonadota bacterium]|nr:hypothetical protein [Pseudomonadota bacterium]
MKKNNFLAFLDISIIDILPQKFQRELILNSLIKQKLNLENVRNENLDSFRDCEVIKKTINGKFKVQGFAFFSLLQFCYGKKFRYDLVDKIIKKKQKIYFFREDLLIQNSNELKKLRKSLLLFKINNQKFIDKILTIQ